MEPMAMKDINKLLIKAKQYDKETGGDVFSTGGLKKTINKDIIGSPVVDLSKKIDETVVDVNAFYRQFEGQTMLCLNVKAKGFPAIGLAFPREQIKVWYDEMGEVDFSKPEAQAENITGGDCNGREEKSSEGQNA